MFSDFFNKQHVPSTSHKKILSHQNQRIPISRLTKIFQTHEIHIEIMAYLSQKQSFLRFNAFSSKKGI